MTSSLEDNVFVLNLADNMTSHFYVTRKLPIYKIYAL